MSQFVSSTAALDRSSIVSGSRLPASTELYVHALLPEARLRGGDGNIKRALPVEADKFITRRGVRHVYFLAVHGDSEGRRAHLRRHRRGLNARSSLGGEGKLESGHDQ